MDASVNFYIYFFCNREIRARVAELYAGVKRQANSNLNLKYIFLIFGNSLFKLLVLRQPLGKRQFGRRIGRRSRSGRRQRRRAAEGDVPGSVRTAGAGDQVRRRRTTRKPGFPQKKRGKKRFGSRRRGRSIRRPSVPPRLILRGNPSLFFLFPFYLLLLAHAPQVFPRKKEGKEKGCGLKNIFSRQGGKRRKEVL